MFFCFPGLLYFILEVKMHFSFYKKPKEIHNSMWHPIQTENINDNANSNGLVLITTKELQYRTNFREGKMVISV